MDGLIVIDKPAGPTSHDVVARMRRVLGERRIGHTGTLDPNASGVLPLVIGRATRLAKFLSGERKRYEAIVRLGVSTTTYDGEGTQVGLRWTGPLPSRAELERALEGFRGSFLQQPPAFSAKKIDGERSYASARSGAAVMPAPVTVTVDRLDIIELVQDELTLHVECSAGFYVRSLAHDLGKCLGTGAHLSALRRTASGALTLDDAVPLEFAERSREEAIDALLPLDAMLPQFGAVVLNDEGLLRVVHGRNIGMSEVVSGSLDVAGPIRLVDQRGQLVAIAERTAASGVLHPSVVLR
ncbi:MAG TPA: tRNA pseudouridine(55) synthase TruB [Vicinamibacterales bacterium]|nr:tRNA pseudouridine(55) synthase TruB [Vicinamibacterales bacterium]